MKFRNKILSRLSAADEVGINWDLAEEIQSGLTAQELTPILREDWSRFLGKFRMKQLESNKGKQGDEWWDSYMTVGTLEGTVVLDDSDDGDL